MLNQKNESSRTRTPRKILRNMIQPIHSGNSMPNLVVSSSSESHGSCGSCSGSSMEDDSKKRTVNHDYHDHSKESPTIMDVKKMKQEEEDIKKRRGPRGGVAQPFPEKLHLMLSTLGREDIVTWQPHGRCFVVHNAKAFVNQVMPKYFRQTKLTSFQRQLNLYGFCRLTGGRDRGGYYHELFLRNRPFLCKRMMRTRIKGTGIKAASSPQTEVSHDFSFHSTEGRMLVIRTCHLTYTLSCLTARLLPNATCRGLAEIVGLC
jgi:hypothetical protein